MKLAEDDPRSRERLSNVVDGPAHPLLPPSELLGRERDGETPLGLVILQAEEGLRGGKGLARRKGKGRGRVG